MQPGRATLIGILVLIVMTSEAASTQAPRRVYVLHSGIHVILSRSGKNGAAVHLREELLARGVPDANIVVLDNPFPAATLTDMFPRESALMYLESADPASATSQEAYRRLDRALQQAKVSARDEICWIGHSAGGQMGMTLAHLAQRLHDNPELPRSTRPYRFSMVVTLGTPVASNHVPADVALRHYYSSADTIVGMLAKHGSVVRTALGPDVALKPCCNPGPNVKVRVFQGIRHHQWCWSAAVVDAILAEGGPTRGRCSPDSPCTHGLAQLFSLGLEQAIGLSFEE